MGMHVSLAPERNKELRRVNPSLVSFNIEMTEVTGGTFWVAYTPEQVAGTEPFEPISDWHDLKNLQQWYDPIDLTDPKLIKLARELGHPWVRVSGTWANKTYYDFDGHTQGKVPEGFQNLLTKDQWISVLDFVKAIDGKLLVSFANCPGIHAADEPWPTDQAKLLLDFSRDYGAPIDAAEFTNEPTMPTAGGLPEGYTPEQFARDHDIFVKFMRENYPETMIVGPCTVGDYLYSKDNAVNSYGGGLAAGFGVWTTESVMDNVTESIDVFSHHYYNGVSERGAAMGGHWPESEILTDEYLAVAGDTTRFYVPRRDKYAPGAEMWVTESAGGGGGGNTWDSTYADVPRTLNELGDFCTITDGVIFHNTLASAAYGLLEHGTFEPRPNYFAEVLWTRIMGSTVYECGNPATEGAHMYCHSRKDGEDGFAYLVINNSTTDSTTVDLPKDACVYELSGNGNLRSTELYLNGKALTLEDGELPVMEGRQVEAGTIDLKPATCTFIVL